MREEVCLASENAPLDRELSLRAFRFAEEIQRSDDMQSLSQATEGAVLAVGMTAVASGLVSGPSRKDGRVFHFVNWPQDWLDLYIAEGYIDKDPVPRWATVSGTPVSWTGLLKSLSTDDPGHEVYKNAAKWRFTEGFVTPTRGMDGSLGLVSVGGEREALSLHECLYLQSVSAATFQRAEAILDASQSATAPPTLMARESFVSEYHLTRDSKPVIEDLLRNHFALTRAEWRVASSLYKGDSLQGIAAVQGLSINTVRVQLASIYAKTGTHRQVELVAAIRDLIGN